MLELQGLTKTYQHHIALNDISLKVSEGEVYGLLGPNGAGKSTLIRILNQILTPDKGHIKFNHQLLTRKHLNEFGYLPEERGMYKSMTVEKHGIFLGQLRGMTKSDAIKMLDFWLEKMDILDWKKKRIEELSKGMAQKIQFIFTVLHQPKLIILDEPFSGFDPVNIELIKNEISRLKKEGCAILISTHNMNSVEELCDKAMLINKGKMIAEGTIDELLSSKQKGLYVIRFEGNMIGFVTALWAGFELVDQKELAPNKFEVKVALKGESTIDNLMQVLIGNVKVESIAELKPTMQEVFIQLVTESNATQTVEQ
jgi:ABC-2 type transport system ATP-binding protein